MNKYLQFLEEEAIYIIREAMEEFNNPVFLYSIGKDSSVLLHLILKAFYPIKPDLPLLHIDTGWKFKEMIKFRNEISDKYGVKLIIYQNMEAVKKNINPFDHVNYTDIMKTQALRQAIDKYKFDAALGGARRDEEKSRAKERIFSFRNNFHNWDPKNQRPELFNNFNTKLFAGQSMRVFPLSNWSEIDIWQYIKKEEIDIVSLYFAKKRPVTIIKNNKIMVDDNRVPVKSVIQDEMIRFRTLGCYPLTLPVNSNATNIDMIIDEVTKSKFSERQGRLIDNDQAASMEIKKQQGYF